jgi:hypothetical protein
MSEADLRRLLADDEPADLQSYLSTPSTHLRFQGTTVPALGARVFGPTGSRNLSAPIDASGPAPIDFMGSYLTLEEFFDLTLPDGRQIPADAVVRWAADHHDRRTMTMALALLGRMVAEPAVLEKLTEDFLKFLAPPARVRVQALLTSESMGLGRLLTSRQPVLSALRWVLSEDPSRDPDQGVPPLVAAILLCQAIASALDAEADRTQQTIAGQPAHLVMEITRIGMLYEQDDVLSSLDWTHSLWTKHGSRLSKSRLRAPPADLFLEATGLEVEDMLALGFATYLHSMQWEDPRRIFLNRGMGSGMDAAKIETFVNLVSATAATYRISLAAATSRFDFLPFQRKPVFDAEPDLLVLDQIYLLERITSGLFWDVNDHERAVGGLDAAARWHEAYGEMIEASAEERLSVLSPPILGGGKSYYTEDDFGDAYEGPRCDAAIDMGIRFVVIEVVSGQLSVPTRIDGSVEGFTADTDRLVIQKCRQLDASARALIEDEARLTGHSAPSDKRVLPVLVIGGGYPVNPFSVEYITEALRTAALLTHALIEPLAIIDPAELDALQALQEQGHAFDDVLSKWQASGLRRISLRNFISREYPGRYLRSTLTADRARLTTSELIKRLRLPDQPEVASDENSSDVAVGT